MFLMDELLIELTKQTVHTAALMWSLWILRKLMKIWTEWSYGNSREHQKTMSGQEDTLNNNNNDEDDDDDNNYYF